MPRKRVVRRRAEILSRNVVVASVQTSVHLYAETPRGEVPPINSNPWIEVRGATDEPVCDVREIQISLHLDDRTEPGPVRPALVGAVLRLRPDLDVVVGFPYADFDRLWTMVLVGHLKFGRPASTQPRYNKALVVSVSFSTTQEE